MMRDHQESLRSWMTEFLASGRVAFSREEAVREVGTSRGAFLDAAERLQRQGRLIKPRHGFYVTVPPQFLAWGAPPASWYIDDLMRFAGRDYYVGLLQASDLLGSSPQAIMEFQVVTDKQLTRLRAGRAMISFHYRRDLASIWSGVEEHKTATGYMKVSSPELTALDLLRYAPAIGGLDNVATILVELATKIDAEKLAVLSKSFARSVVRRLGYLLDSHGYSEKVMLMRKMLGDLPDGWVELDPTEAMDPVFAPKPIEREPSWRVVVRRVPELDS
ncbi:MAG: type IV toxin-antitoxin system AbiEi family antitoxin [Deltaproteobacteria bacterium]|nr:type IV toxin-antitoxin system AbiEi family antitoxin [Deltaproteobacteria bacterium]